MRPHTEVKLELKHNYYDLLKISEDLQFNIQWILFLRNGHAIISHWTCATCNGPPHRHWSCEWAFHLTILDMNTQTIIHQIHTEELMRRISQCPDGSFVMTDSQGYTGLWKWKVGEHPVRFGSCHSVQCLQALTNEKFIYGRYESTSDGCVCDVLDFENNLIERPWFKKPAKWANMRQGRLVIRTLKELLISDDEAKTFQSQRIYGSYSLRHRWDYPVSASRYCELIRTHKDRQEWGKTLSREFTYLLPDLWAIVAMYD